MAFENFKPEWWANQVETKLLKKLVFGNLANRAYEGIISGAGSTVRVSQIGSPTVSDYTQYSDMSIETLEDAQKVLTIDQDKYFNFTVDDLDKVQANVDLISPSTSLGGYELANVADQYIAGLYGSAGLSSSSLGTTGSPLSVNSANVHDVFVEAGKVMDKNDVPDFMRVAVIPAWLAAKLTLAEVGLLTENRESYVNGYLGTVNKIQLFQSNNVSEASDETNSKVMFFIEGMTFSFASQMLKFEAYRPEKRFEDAVKARFVFGAKAMRPDTLLTAYLTAGAES